MNTKLTELFIAELDRESVGTRKALERVPEGKYDWKPHAKSMPLGYLAALVATMPAWIVRMIDDDELDFAPPGGSSRAAPKRLETREDLVRAFDDSIARAKEALARTTDEHLFTSWRLLAGGHVISEHTRYINIRDGVINHLAHHRGQLTVYLRLNEEPVPSLYGPTADEPIG